MTPLRLLVLLFGPIPIVVGSLAVSRVLKSEGPVRAEGNHVVSVNAVGKERVAPQRQAARRLGRVADRLEAQCREVAAALAQRLGGECAVVVHAPFVIAGDLAHRELDRWFTQTIGPASRAMAQSYFRVSPDRPIQVLLFAGEQSYDHYADALYGDAGVSIYGYYKRGQRTLVMNIATGGGTLVHELTHALADFDCPKIPDWLNEGLASLHEQCRIREDESGIDGLENWRLPHLQQAIRRGRLRSLESLIRNDDFRQHDVGLNYAQARYFCLFLQQRGVLDEFVRQWRADQAADPLGIAAVGAVFPDKTWTELDQEFCQWARELVWRGSTAAKAARGDQR